MGFADGVAGFWPVVLPRQGFAGAGEAVVLRLRRETTALPQRLLVKEGPFHQVVEVRAEAALDGTDAALERRVAVAGAKTPGVVEAVAPRREQVAVAVILH